VKDTAIVKLFCALGNLYRIDIIRHLMENEELNVKGVTECMGFFCDQSIVSKHLKILKDAGLVNSRNKGTNVFYSINNEFMCCDHDLLSVSFQFQAYLKARAARMKISEGLA
jgi:ArsR family transcriptional regulator